MKGKPMGTAEQELSNLWWQIDIALRYSTADILRVQSVVDPFAPAQLVSIRGVQGSLFEESRDSVLQYDVAEFRRILSDMPLATLVWGSFYFCTREQHERMPVAWRELNP